MIKQPLTLPELKRLAKKLGGVRELIAPKRKKEMEPIPDGEVLAYLAANPNYVRRPIIDTGERAVGGFTAATREQLADL